MLVLGNSRWKCLLRSTRDNDVWLFSVAQLVIHLISCCFRKRRPYRCRGLACVLICSCCSKDIFLYLCSSNLAMYSLRTKDPEIPKILPSILSLTKEVCPNSVTEPPNFSFIMSSTYCSVIYFMMFYLL